VLFTILDAAADNPRVAVLDSRDQSQKILLPGAASAAYIDAGYLVYAASGTLFAVRFNLDALRVEGEPQTLANGILMGTAMGAYYAISSTGSLAYVPATATPDPPRTLVWVDRAGAETPLNAPARAYQTVRLSPDGQQIAVGINDQQRDLWTWDLQRQTLTQITSHSRADVMPLWTPDGQRLVFQSRRDGGGNLYAQAADGTGIAEPLTTGIQTFVPTSISPDGATLLGNSSIPRAWTLFQLPLANGERPQPLLPSPANHNYPALSPNGRFVAYQSSESGQFESTCGRFRT
jgi:dipeptidyl aminopeptidase/acylaminoacyl peptidase